MDPRLRQPEPGDSRESETTVPPSEAAETRVEGRRLRRWRRLRKGPHGEEGRAPLHSGLFARPSTTAAVTAVPPKANGALRLVTLNVAHGRPPFSHQAVLPRRLLERNLRGIAARLRVCDGDIIALQEADGPSAWSGNFDHVATLAELTGSTDSFRGDHNRLALGRYRLASGTALLARTPLTAPVSRRFAACWRDTKGYVKATVVTPGGELDAVSVHLDFLAPAIRRRQIRQLTEELGDRRRPMVILGDLNCGWRRERRSLELLLDRLELVAYAPGSHAPTYPSYRPTRRLDWILASPELHFEAYRTVLVRHSDHLAVVADLRLI